MNDSKGSFANRKALKGRKRKERSKKRSFFNIKWILLVIVATIFLIMGGCSAVILAGNYAIDEDKLVMPQTSVFLDAEGNEFGQVAEEDREYVSFDEMPDYLGEAFIAVEDRRFYDHYGVDPRSVLRAIWVDLKTWSLKEGSSTITMQLARNVFLTNEKEWSRKIKEAMIAINLEQNYTKEQILEMYLNQILFGHGKYGVETAADWYFGKTVRTDGEKETISLSEAAMLAGIPKAPSTYSPKQNLDKAIERRNLVLDLMEEQGFITKEEKETAMAEEIKIVEHEGGNKYQAYLDLVRKEAQERYDLSEDELNRGGYKIYTNLNRQAQEAVEEAYSNDELFPPDGENGKVESGLTMLNPKTGEIVAVAGGRDYEAGFYNRSYDARVQVGSAMKPIVTYAPAIEFKGMQPYDTVEDKPIEGKDGQPWPRNAGGRYHGTSYMIDAVKHSYNAAAVRTLRDVVGVKSGYDFATKLGLDIPEELSADDAYSLTLGANDASTLEMAQAYSPFANQGVLIEAHAINKIEASDGSRMRVDDPQVKEVMSAKTAYYMTEMLKAVVNEGTGTRARISGREIAGKTGTTNDGTRIWFVGYTPQYVTAIYMGRDEESEIGESSGGPRGPAALFARVMAGALEGMPAESFNKPEGVEKPREPVKLTKITDLRASYDAEAQQVSLSWTDYDERVHYNVYRIEGEGEAALIGETEGGSFTDGDIEVPERGGGLSSLFGQAKGKTYHYYVVPVNAETGETGDQSNTATVVIEPPDDEELPEEEDETEEDEEERTLPEDEDSSDDDDNSGNGEGPGNSNPGEGGSNNGNDNPGGKGDGSGDDDSDENDGEEDPGERQGLLPGVLPGGRNA